MAFKKRQMRMLRVKLIYDLSQNNLKQQQKSIKG
jgi:hypothetical protein